jgi:4-amino-4-deoxy-L-arabinose transferase-like glycosyltransferase
VCLAESPAGPAGRVKGEIAAATAPGPRPTGRAGLAAAALPMVFLVLASMYSVVTPAWEAPDEIGHFEYVRHLALTGRLPVQDPAAPNAAHQPPLYYAAAALLTAAVGPGEYARPRFNQRSTLVGHEAREVNVVVHSSAETFPFEGAALALQAGRLVGVLFGTLTVALTTALARQAFPQQPGAWLLGGGLVALNPQFLFVGGAMNNDSMVALTGAGAAWATLRALERPERSRGWALLGGWLALGLLAKATAVAPAAAVAVIGAAVVVRRRSLGTGLRIGLALATPVALGFGPWVVRNLRLYGEPTGYAVYRQAWAPSLRSEPFGPADLGQLLTTQFRTYWATFGWMNLPAPGWLYLSFAALCLVAAIGLARRPAPPAVPLLLAFVLVQELYVLGIALDCNVSCYQGRYLFAAIGPIGALLGFGLARVLPRAGGHGVLAALVVVALGAPWALIRPAYATVPEPKWRQWLIERPTAYRVGAAFELVGYDLRPGDGELRVTLYWRALARPDFDYSAFVHLIDRDGRIVAQQDHAPGEARGYPPRAWAVGDLIRDEHVLTAPGARLDEHRLRVGLYNWQTGQQLPIRQGDRQLGGAVVLPSVGGQDRP